MSSRRQAIDDIRNNERNLVQIITDPKGAPAFAVLPWERFLVLLGDDLDAREEAEDIAALRAAMAEDDEDLPEPFVARLIDGEHPIRVWRRYRGLTQTVLAERLGIKPAYLSQIETRKRIGALDLYKRISKALEVHIDDLVD